MKKTLFLFSLGVLASFFSCAESPPEKAMLDNVKLSEQYFGADYEWYLDKIPFFECSDKEIERVYYYRWEMYKAHIKTIGNDRYVITEFINPVSWDRAPYGTINAASMHHIYEGRWLRDRRYIDSYIDYLYQEGGNNRSYSESVADATYGYYLVNGDAAFATRQLEEMQSVYEGWNDHWEDAKCLYYIPSMPDATEYNIAGVEGSGGTDGFEGGEAFRPTINSYMYANALAIAAIADLKGDTQTSARYRQRAASLKKEIQDNLWHEHFQHFVDRYKVDNEFVTYWDFIPGRELAGFAPWYFNLPDDEVKYHQAWKHLTDTTRLLGPYGFRTNEPSYRHYFTIFLWHDGKPGSQWNGPSWPFQTSIALTGMANTLQRYNQDVLSVSDYLHSLRLFTRQHYLPDGTVNLVENYDPNIGEPIVHYLWSNHYNHSSFNNLIISGLCGIMPSAGNVLDIHPLVDESITYFCLDKLDYHGHQLTLVYDKDGSKYGMGEGVTLLVDSKKVKGTEKNGTYSFDIGPAVVKSFEPLSGNMALNLKGEGYPMPSASFPAPADSLYQALDGRSWYFPEITNGWSTAGSTADGDWFGIDFGKDQQVSAVKIHLLVDGERYNLPDKLEITYMENGKWLPVRAAGHTPSVLTANTVNTLSFEPVKTSAIRINITHPGKDVFFSEVECL